MTETSRIERLALCLRSHAYAMGAPRTEQDEEVALGAARLILPAMEESAATCRNCEGAGWVCENHADRPWGGNSASPLACECGAGAPCPACCLELASAGYAERERQRITAWLRGLDEHYSGWNPHDEQFDSGYDSAIKWVADSLEKRIDIRSAPEHGEVILDIESHLARDSGGLPKGEAGTAECEASQSGLNEDSGIAQPLPPNSPNNGESR